MHGRQAGVTLVGELVALAIIGTVIAILLTGLSTSSSSVAATRQRITAENYARRQMETIKAAPYRRDPTAAPYPMASVAGGYTVTVGIRYWLTPTFRTTVPTTVTDQGLQEVTVSVFTWRAPQQPTFVLQGYKGNRP
jgi:type II secretory pathway pseudopilin PulG